MINKKKTVDIILLTLIVVITCFAVTQTIDTNINKSTTNGASFYISGKDLQDNPVTLANTSTLCQTSPCNGGW